MTPNECSPPSEGVPTHLKYLLTYIITDSPAEFLQKLASLAGNLSPRPVLAQFWPPTGQQRQTGSVLKVRESHRSGCDQGVYVYVPPAPPAAHLAHLHKAEQRRNGCYVPVYNYSLYMLYYRWLERSSSSVHANDCK